MVRAWRWRWQGDKGLEKEHNVTVEVAIRSEITQHLAKFCLDLAKCCLDLAKFCLDSLGEL